MTINQNNVLRSYGDENWGELPNFCGNYINYGYWKDIVFKKRKKISQKERIKSSLSLYNLVENKLSINSDEKILEIGCGRGVGLMHLAREFPRASFTGLDLTSDQIVRAKTILSNLKNKIRNINFEQGAAEKTNFSLDSFDKIFSVEALQHFKSLLKFSQEMQSVLKKNGLLCVTTYFSNGEAERKKLEDFFPLISQEIEEPFSIKDTLETLEKNKFEILDVTSIGEHVFYGYEAWITQQQVSTPFSHYYYEAYQKNYIDYYIILAKKL